MQVVAAGSAFFLTGNLASSLAGTGLMQLLISGYQRLAQHRYMEVGGGQGARGPGGGAVVPGLMRLLISGYQRLAQHRCMLGGGCNAVPQPCHHSSTVPHPALPSLINRTPSSPAITHQLYPIQPCHHSSAVPHPALPSLIS